jgi:hypothetical protein
MQVEAGDERMRRRVPKNGDSGGCLNRLEEEEEEVDWAWATWAIARPTPG